MVNEKMVNKIVNRRSALPLGVAKKFLNRKYLHQMNPFDDIRSFNDNEVPAGLARLCDEKQFVNFVSTVYPLMPKDIIKQKLKSFTSSYKLHEEFMIPFFRDIEANLTKGIDLLGLEKIDTSKSYLYISNHRDIVLDAAFLCLKFVENKIDTVEIAVGDNLLLLPWIEQFVRVSRAFIVKRGGTVRQIFENSKLLSAYIFSVINEKKRSIWLAQREGRSKDSDDRTQESLLKMLNMNGKTTNMAQNLMPLNICPLNISYEYDPCDYLKAKELQQRRDDPDFQKLQKDDLLSVRTGVMGYKGKIVYSITGCINADLQTISENITDKNIAAKEIATLIDSRIHSNYTIFNINKIAFDLLHNTNRFNSEYSLMEKLNFERYIQKQIAKIDLAEKDIDFLMKKLLEMYSNPLKNFMMSRELLTV